MYIIRCYSSKSRNENRYIIKKLCKKLCLKCLRLRLRELCFHKIITCHFYNIPYKKYLLCLFDLIPYLYGVQKTRYSNNIYAVDILMIGIFKIENRNFTSLNIFKKEFLNFLPPAANGVF